MLWTVPVPNFEHVRQIHAVEMLMDLGGPGAYVARDKHHQDWLFLNSGRKTLDELQEETWLAVPVTPEQRHDLIHLETVSYQQICEDSPGPFRVIGVSTRKHRQSDLSSDVILERRHVPEHWWPRDHAQIIVRPAVQRT